MEKDDQLQLKSRIWIEIKDRTIIGKADLLRKTAEPGSLRKAASEFNLSYRQAWYSINQINKIFIIAFILLSGIKIFAQEEGDTSSITEKVFHLGEVYVVARMDKTTISADDMLKYNSGNVSSALRILPSLVISTDASRNESTIYLRGFDIRSVPVYIDGIPVYVPFDGYVDLARFTTFDIARIDVAKGFASMTYGANTIGGAINLIGIKPSHKLEMNTSLGLKSGRGLETRLNLGSNLGKIYIQSGFSLLKKEFVRLSDDFDTTALETNHQLDNSHQQDIKGSFRIGFTPNLSDEYSISYLYSNGSKGNPVYLGTDKNTRVRFWRWPYWDKQSIYYISKTAVGIRSVMKIRMYFDQFRNKLSCFDDGTYTTQERAYAFNSFYDDYTLGGNIEFLRDWNADNHLKLSLHLKNDNHSEHNDDEPVRHFADNTFSLGIENVFKPNNRLSFVPGISYNFRKSLRAENYNSVDSTISEYSDNNNDALNAQLGSYYKVSDAVNFSFNVALKSRFATMKDRYSYRLGTALPNPHLKSETAVNMELASGIKISEVLDVRPGLFYSRLNNTIQIVNNVQDDLSQMLNTGKAVYKGMDLNIDYKPVKDLSICAVWSYILRENISNPGILFTDVPEHKLFTSIEYLILKKALVNLFSEYYSKRNSASDGSRVSPGFFLLNARTSYPFGKYFTAESGINNIFDKNYSLQEGYPEAGRNYYIAMYFNLQK